MSSAAKRVLTDEIRDSILASSSPLHSSTPPDVAASLRSVGSRVRKSVTEGYNIHNSSYVKAHSTGTVFRSANDTLRDIFPSGSPAAALPPSKLKRTHTQSEEYDSDGGIDDDNIEMHPIIPDISQTSIDAKGFNRPVRALRKPRRTMLTTRSLPGGALGFGHPMGKSMGDGALAELEEEDWSIPTCQPHGSIHITSESLNDQSSFEPMILA